MHKEGRTGNITSKEFIDEREICYENRVLMVSMCVLLMTGITACGRNNADNGAGVNEATEGTDKKNEMNGAGTYNTESGTTEQTMPETARQIR